MKKIILLLLLITTLFGVQVDDIRLLRYPEAKEWLLNADKDGEAAYNIGVLYHQVIKDDEKAIVWYKKAYDMDDEGAAESASVNIAAIYILLKEYAKAEKWYKKGILKGSSQAAFGLGLLYKKLHQYNDAIFYYKKAYTMRNIDGAFGLGQLYIKLLNQPQKGVKWYMIAAKDGDRYAIKNLARYYKLDKNNNIKAGAYFLSLINNGYSKQKVLTYLKTKWKLTDEEIKKAYQLQKTLDIPKHYYDVEFEDKVPKKRAGRR